MENSTKIAERAKEPEEGKGITLTPSAAEQVKKVMGENKMENAYLFIGVKGGGCSGLTYVLDIRDEDEVPAEGHDEIFASQGVNIVCDLKSFVVGNLGGTSVDYTESLMGAGFVFSNPNSKTTCGCGSSYST